MIAEAALEIIPIELTKHKSILNHAKKLNRSPSEIFLDTSYHHAAMLNSNLKYWWKRGRPDIIHFDLLEANSTPLFLKGKLSIYVSTIDNKLLILKKNLRLPKSYVRFEGLMRNIYGNRNNSKSHSLIELRDDIEFDYLIKKIIRPDVVIGLSTKGKFRKLADLISGHVVDQSNHYCFVVGGFQKGSFSEKTTSTFDYLYRINNYHLESHVVISRLIYECENLPINVSPHPP